MAIKSTSKVNIKQARTALLSAKASIAQARAQSSFRFSLVNTAKDVTARNPKHQIFYYDAVTNGRAALTATGENASGANKLHFKVGPGKRQWIVTESVRRAKPLRITQRAKDLIAVSMPQAVAAEFVKAGGLPTGKDFIRAFAVMKFVVLREFKEVTNSLTRHSNTKASWYGAEGATPLAESFVTIDGKLK